MSTYIAVYEEFVGTGTTVNEAFDMLMNSMLVYGSTYEDIFKETSFYEAKQIEVIRELQIVTQSAIKKAR